MTHDIQDIFASYDCKIVIEPSLLAMAKELMALMGFEKKQLLAVCDQSTHQALGARIVKELDIPYLLLEGVPHADAATIELIRSQKVEALIAVGSGTISDLCKYASFLDGIEYAVFPTAPSMNGYFSANASITMSGHKLTLPAHLPKGIFCDLEVLSHAPKRLILSGLGDSLCRPTAQADWLLSHLLFNTPYNPKPFELLKPYEEELFLHPEKLIAGNLQAIKLLMQTLLISGLGMVMAGGSYPASQGEHLIAHTMEMKHGSKLPYSYHGEQIGVTTLVMAEIQQQLLSHPLRLKKVDAPEKKIASYFGSSLAGSIYKTYQDKLSLYEKYDVINARLVHEDKNIRERIRAVTIPEKQLRYVLSKVSAPALPADIGWNELALRQATQHAMFIRNRFTFLDLQPYEEETDRNTLA